MSREPSADEARDANRRAWAAVRPPVAVRARPSAAETPQDKPGGVAAPNAGRAT